MLSGARLHARPLELELGVTTTDSLYPVCAVTDSAPEQLLPYAS